MNASSLTAWLPKLCLGLCPFYVWVLASTKAAAQDHNAAQGKPLSSIRLTDISKHCGIDFVHTDGGTGKRYIVESVVAGLATLDFDGDGFTDIYFVNGGFLDSAQSEAVPRNALYRNNGDFTFTDVTQQAGVGKPGYGMGAVAADFDQDGFPDLYVSNFGQNVLYRNNGDGTFADITQSSQLILPDRVGAGCAFLDIERDGDLDLYVGSYVRFSVEDHQARFIGKHQFHPGPTDYQPSPDALFRNNGNGTFTNISDASGISGFPSYSMGVVAFDVDEDSDIDIMLGNDQRANTLWINDGKGKFEDQALVRGVAFDRLGNANGNRGVEIGEVNGDGQLDIFTTTYQDEMPVLYLNMGGGLFMDQTNTAQIDNRLHPHVSWGCGLVDFDNDADLDIYVACGHFLDNIQFIDDRTTVKVRDFVLENRNGKFVDVTTQAGLQIVESSRGAAFEDFDNDGDIDVVVLNTNARPSVLRNDTQADPGVLLRLVGTRSNRSAVGAKIKMPVGSVAQVQQVVSGRGYQSQYGRRQHFAVGRTAKVASPELIEIQWSSGIQETVALQRGVRQQLIIEGEGHHVPRNGH